MFSRILHLRSQFQEAKIEKLNTDVKHQIMRLIFYQFANLWYNFGQRS